MGFFGKILSNLKRGGVRVQMNAPMYFNWNDAQIPIEVTLTTSEPRTINTLTYQLVQSLKDTSHGTDSSHNKALVSQVIKEPFTLVPNMPVTKNYELLLKPPEGAADQIQLPDGQQIPEAAQRVFGAIAGRLAGLSTSMIDEKKYDLYLEVIADVDGITIDPSARQLIRVNKPGQIGGGTGIRIGI